MSNYMWGEADTQFFYHLTPEIVMDAIEKLGLKITGRCLTLNSMENRVYEIELDSPITNTGSPSDNFVVAKFYRPGRWTKEQILEEHEFLLDLHGEEFPVIAPIKIDGATLFDLEDHNLFYCIFPKKGGRAPDEFKDEDLEIMGRSLARLHSIGKMKEAKHRLEIKPETYSRQNFEFLISNKSLPPHLEESYTNAINMLEAEITPLFKDIKTQRIHGDCHKGNIIWRDEQAFFIDFDDMLVGPPVQDIWLLVPGIDMEAKQQRSILLEAYETMNSFDYSTLKLIEPLRALRFIHFSAWIAKRWEDPAFKLNFPFFGSETYWHQQINDLHTQIRLIKEEANPVYY